MDGNISSVNEVIVAEDCRKDLFEGREGFINTFSGKEKVIINNGKYKYQKELAKQSDDLRCAVNWFIEVDGGQDYMLLRIIRYVLIRKEDLTD